MDLPSEATRLGKLHPADLQLTNKQRVSKQVVSAYDLLPIEAVRSGGKWSFVSKLVEVGILISRSTRAFLNPTGWRHAPSRNRSIDIAPGRITRRLRVCSVELEVDPIIVCPIAKHMKCVNIGVCRDSAREDRLNCSMKIVIGPVRIAGIGGVAKEETITSAEYLLIIRYATTKHHICSRTEREDPNNVPRFVGMVSQRSNKTSHS